jgi:hypothetical protein
MTMTMAMESPTGMMHVQTAPSDGHLQLSRIRIEMGAPGRLKMMTNLSVLVPVRLAPLQVEHLMIQLEMLG